MKDEYKTRKQLIRELSDLRMRIAELEKENAEHLKAEGDMRESEERARRMLDAITTYTYSVEVSEGQAISTRHNGACLFVTGYSGEDYQRDPFLWYSMIHPADRGMVEKAVCKILEGQVIPPIEHRIVRRDGTTIWIRNTMVPYVDQQGSLIRYDGMVEDISARKQLEASILRSQKLESLGRMAGAVAHNFNNILATILGNAELIKMELPVHSPEQSRAEQIINACQRAQSITFQIVAYTGHIPVRLEMLNVSELIEGMAPLLEIGLFGKVEIRYRLTVDLPLIHADSNQIKQVIVNLVTNAVEAMGENPGAVVVSTAMVGTDAVLSGESYLSSNQYEGPWIAIEVKDEGCGMDETTKASMFDPFFSTKFLGRGLGLPAVLGIVRRHKGFIRVMSEPGIGTVFQVGFPIGGIDSTELTAHDGAKAFA